MYMLFFWRLSTFGYRSEACKTTSCDKDQMHHNAGLPLTNQHDTLIIGSPKTKSRRDSTAAQRKVCRRDWNVSRLQGCGSAAADRGKVPTCSNSCHSELLPMTDPWCWYIYMLT